MVQASTNLNINFFISTRKKHAGVYLSNGKVIDASTSQGITVSKITDSYWKKVFLAANAT
jgi:lipoprotein Spr